MSADLSEIPQCLWSTTCPNCGYSLQGLPSAGICPECGRSYDQSTVILHGWARGRHENASNAKRSRLIWVLVVSVAWLLPQAILTPRGFGKFWLPMLAAMVLLPELYLLVRRRSADHPGLIQVRLGQRGCVQYDDLAGPSLLRDFLGANLWFVPVFAATSVLVARLAGWIGSIQFWIWFPIACLAFPFGWKSSRRFRRAMRQVRDGAIADFNDVLREPTPWEKVSSFQIRKVSDAGCRLTINAVVPFFSLSDQARTPVDAEISCASEQAAELEELIRTWIARARESQGGGSHLAKPAPATTPDGRDILQ